MEAFNTLILHQLPGRSVWSGPNLNVLLSNGFLRVFQNGFKSSSGSEKSLLVTA